MLNEKGFTKMDEFYHYQRRHNCSNIIDFQIYDHRYEFLLIAYDLQQFNKEGSWT